MKFTDIPVSYYTGTSDVTIPIYNVSVRGLSVPISLAYHTGGIRLKEEASCVGLGWALNAGGAVSRTIIGRDDFTSGTYFSSAVTLPQPDGDIPNPILGGGFNVFWCNYIEHFSGGDVDYTNAVPDYSLPYELEPDIFSYSFMGHSGKFIILKNKSVVFQKQENIKIAFTFASSLNNAIINAFTITDDQGNKYFFNDLEYTASASNTSATTVSSWQISRIVTNLNDTINYTYGNEGLNCFGASDIHQNLVVNCYSTSNLLTQYNDAGNYYSTLSLQTIDFPTGQAQFQYSNSRADLLGGKRLTGVKLYAKQNGTLSYLKEMDLYQSYFNQTSGGGAAPDNGRLKLDSVKEISGAISLPPYVLNYFSIAGDASTSKHSFSIDHWGFYNGASNSVQIPSQSIMYQESVGGSGVPGVFQYNGANRESSSAMNLFALQQIKYPTGGKTVFELEPNDYDYAASLTAAHEEFPYVKLVTQSNSIVISKRGDSSGTFNLSNIFPLGYFGTINATLNVAFRSSANDCNSHYTSTSGKIYFTFNGANYNINEDISNSNIICPGGNYPVSSAVFQLSIPSQSTYNYTWGTHIDPTVGSDFQDIEVTITYQITQQAYNQGTLVNGIYDYTLPAGGLRVKSITNYTDNATIADKKTFAYDYFITGSSGYPEKHSWGRIMSFPSYARQQYADDGTGSGYKCAQLSIFSSSNTALTSATQGNIVGYDHVEETTVDPSSNANIGKTVLLFFNSPDTTILYSGERLSGMNNISNSLNGLLLDKITYSNTNGSNVKVSEEQSFYSTRNRHIYFSPRFRPCLTLSVWNANHDTKLTTLVYDGMSPAPFCGVDQNNFPTHLVNPVDVFFYPSIKSERVLLDSTKQIIYDQLDTNKTELHASYYYYDNPLHYQLSRSITFDSKNNKQVSFITYPQDYIPTESNQTGNSILDTIIANNMVAKVIEKKDSLYYAGNSSGYIKTSVLNTFKLINPSPNIVVSDKIYKLDLTSPISSFQAYSISGNSTSKDSRYRQVISFDQYDSKNNITQFTATDQVPVSVIWDYSNQYPIAKVSNASQSDIAFSSFEADGTGNWTISSSARDATNFITGTQSYNLSNGSVTKSGLTNGKAYLITYWSRNGSYSIGGGTVSTRTGRSVNGWTYYEHSVTASSTTITISGSGNIDELRLFPQGAMMTTYTYAPLVGQTSMGDPNSEITYYEYDALQRLKNVKDYQGNIIKNYQYNYANSCGSNCFVLAMQTFYGNNTLSYPVGVFNVSGQLLGNATSQAQYVSLWNGNSADQAIGTISAGFDSLHFNFTPQTGQTVPSSVIGCRYYQFDIAYTKIDAVRSFNGVYIDFGDGTGFRCDAAPTTGLPANTTVNFFGGSTIAYYVHTYPNSNNKTITFYHTDTYEAPVFDNFVSPATSLTLVSNIRGNFPQNMQSLGSSSMQQASAHDLSNITNWSSINSVLTFIALSGDGGVNANLHMNYAQDFMAANKNLQTISTLYNLSNIGYIDSTFKLSKLKSNWNTYFTGLKKIVISDAHWNRENLSALTQLSTLIIGAAPANGGNYSVSNPVIQIPSSVIDNIINQVASGAGQFVSNGTLNVNGGGTSRTSASDASVTLLKSKGWTIYVSGVQL